jgi:streptomycin 6-kinase
VRTIDVPEIVRRKAALEGVLGLRWLQQLAGLIEELEREWNVRVGSTLFGSTDAYVAEVTTSDGEAAVIKLGIPVREGSVGFRNEITTLLVAEGRGYARLLRHDEDRNAVLLERLGRPLTRMDLSVEAQIEIICALGRAFLEVAERWA